MNRIYQHSSLSVRWKICSIYEVQYEYVRQSTVLAVIVLDLDYMRSYMLKH